jgi:hypothetical protein
VGTGEQPQGLAWGSALVILLIVVALALGIYSVVVPSDGGWHTPVRAKSATGTAASSGGTVQAEAGASRPARDPKPPKSGQ